MRESQETERTHVQSSLSSLDHLEGLVEKETSEQPSHGQQRTDGDETRTQTFGSQNDLESGIENGQERNEHEDITRDELVIMRKQTETDHNLVIWDGLKDPENPQVENALPPSLLS
jgi:hypothetical protein